MQRKAILLAGLSLAVAVAAAVAAVWLDRPGHSGADPTNVALVEHGRKVYADHCASCHGAQLEGQANWQQELPMKILLHPAWLSEWLFRFRHYLP